MSNSDNIDPVKTGFKELDKVLDGGIYPEQLIVISGVSGIGKTSFVLQTATYIASAEIPVVYYSMEAGWNLTVSKCISRLTYEIAKKKCLPTALAKNMRDISNNNRYAKYSKIELALIEEAKEYFKDSINDMFYFREIDIDTDVSMIANGIREFRHNTGSRPVLIIDCLQYLASFSSENDLRRLKLLARDEGIPIIAVYLMSGGKSSHAVFGDLSSAEGFCDVIMELKYSKSKSYACGSEERITELVTLKNRSFSTPEPIRYKFSAEYGFFEEMKKVGLNKNDRSKKLSDINNSIWQ